MEPFPEELNRKLNLSEWILKLDKHILLNPNFYESGKEYVYESYKKNSKLRKYFHKDFLPEIDSNLGFPSSKKTFQYKDYFKTNNYPKYDLADSYFYNDDLNLFQRNKSSLNIKQKHKEESLKYDNNSKIRSINNQEKNDIISNENNSKKGEKQKKKFIENSNNEEDELSSKKIKNRYIKNNKTNKEDINKPKRIKKRENYLYKDKENTKYNKEKSNRFISNKSIKKMSLNRKSSESCDNDESEKATIFNYLETYGKQIEDSSEFSESKKFPNNS